MTKLRIPIAATAALAVAAAVAVSANAGATKIVAFKATYKGTATTKITGSRVDISARATGIGTLIGKSTFTGVGVGTKGDAACVPFSGPATIVTSTKLRLKFTVQPSSTGCGSQDNNTVTVSGTAKFASGGTGRFKIAAGIFTFSGYYDRGTGAFSVKFSGTLRIPK